MNGAQKGSLAPYNPVSKACRDNFCILGISLMQTPPELSGLPVIGFESGAAFLTWATTQFLNLQRSPWRCSCIVKDSLHSWPDHFMNEFRSLQRGVFEPNLWWAVFNRCNGSVFLMHRHSRWALELLQTWSTSLRHTPRQRPLLVCDHLLRITAYCHSKEYPRQISTPTRCRAVSPASLGHAALERTMPLTVLLS